MCVASRCVPGPASVVRTLQRVHKDCRTASATASKWWNNLETEQPILRSDEYLPTGGMLVPSVLSQQAHMVPCCRSFQKKRLFSSGCLQFIYTDRRTCCLTVSRLRKAAVLFRDAFWNVATRWPLLWCLWVPATVRKPGHKSNKKHFNSPKSSANLPSPSFRRRGLQLSVGEPLRLQLVHASLSNVTANPQWALITVTPSGRKEYIFMWQ